MCLTSSLHSPRHPILQPDPHPVFLLSLFYLSMAPLYLSPSAMSVSSFVPLSSIFALYLSSLAALPVLWTFSSIRPHCPLSPAESLSLLCYCLLPSVSPLSSCWTTRNVTLTESMSGNRLTKNSVRQTKAQNSEVCLSCVCLT